MSDLRVRAIRYIQSGRVFYAAVLPASQLIDVSTVDIWRADADPETTGYQRAPTATHVNGIARYVGRDDAVLPLGGLVNARAKDGSAHGQLLKFQPDEKASGDTATGWLTIPSAVLPIYVVDMQHRLAGISKAIARDGRDDLKDFPLLVTIADGMSRIEEIEQFELVNTTQQRVRTDLARQLMAIQMRDVARRPQIEQRRKAWEARGASIATILNRDCVVWQGRITPPNTRPSEAPRALTKETSFVTSLKPVLQSPYFSRLSDEEVADILDEYWQALERLFPDAFQHPAQHVIQKTPGIFSVHSLAPQVIDEVKSAGRPLVADEIEHMIESWRALGSAFWAVENPRGAAKYGSMKGFSTLAGELKSVLLEAI